MPIREELLFYAEDSTFKSGYLVTQELCNQIKTNQIDSIVYGNDDIAIGGLNCLLDEGIDVPNDVSLIGTTDLPRSAMLTPSITTQGTNDKYLEYQFAVDYLAALILGDSIENVLEKYSDRMRHYEHFIFERETVSTKKKEV